MVSHWVVFENPTDYRCRHPIAAGQFGMVMAIELASDGRVNLRAVELIPYGDIDLNTSVVSPEVLDQGQCQRIDWAIGQLLADPYFEQIGHFGQNLGVIVGDLHQVLKGA